MIKLEIDSLRVRHLDSKLLSPGKPYVLVLKDNSARCLVIYLGPAQADVIRSLLTNRASEVTSTHELLLSVLNAYGGKLESAVISDYKDGAFKAKLILTQCDVDALPCDAIALALLRSKPIYAAESVMAKQGIALTDIDGCG